MDESDVPRWSPDDHLMRVYTRGRTLRRRRVAVMTGLPALAVALVITLVLVPRGSDRPHGLRTLAGPNPSTSAVPPDTRSADAPTTAPPDSGSGATVTSRAGGSRQVTSTTAGLHAGEGGTTTVPIASTTTTADVPAACTDADLDYSTITDKAAYAKGDTVTISLVVRNRSSHSCEGPGRCGVGPWAAVEDSAGTQVWRNNPIAVSCTNPPPPPPRLDPGQSTTYQAGSWNQKVCPNQGSTCSNKQASSGSYRAIAHRGSVTAAAASFTLN